MSSQCDQMRQVRLDPDNEELLNAVKARCPWGVSLCRLANQAIRAGAAELKRSFNPKSSTTKHRK